MIGDPHGPVRTGSLEERLHDQAVVRSHRRLIWMFVGLLITAWLVFTLGTRDVDAARPSLIPAHATADIWLTEGSTGDHVTEAQSILAHHGWTIAVDGIYGPQTENVVTRFQEVSGLYVDGIIGPQTWDALQSVAPGAAPSGGWDGPIPAYYGGSSGCSNREADVVADAFRARGASDESIYRMLNIISRESKCDEGAYADRPSTGDDSFSLCQMNALSGHFDRGGILAGFDRWALLSDFDLAAEACATLWAECGFGPWNRGNYYCRKPSS